MACRMTSLILLRWGRMLLMYTLTSWPRCTPGVHSASPAMVGRELHEHAVRLHAAHDAHHGLARAEQRRVFLPGAQQLLHAQHQPPCASRQRSTQRMSCPTLTRSAGEAMRETDRLSMGNSAEMPQADVAEGAERFDVCDAARQQVAGSQCVKVFRLQRFCAAARLTSTGPSSGTCCTRKQQLRPTRVISAMSRTFPSRTPSAHSSCGITAGMPSKSKCSAFSPSRPQRAALQQRAGHLRAAQRLARIVRAVAAHPSAW